MKLLARGTTINAQAPSLVFLHAVEGFLTDPAALTFAVYDATTEERQLAPVEVVAPTAVDVGEESAARLGPGRFAATWALSGGLALGLYEARWRYRTTVSGPEQEARELFEVVPGLGVHRGPFYCALSDLRAEGLTAGVLSDARALAAIQRASLFVERATRRFFEPRYARVLLDGRGARALLFDAPIIALEDVAFVLPSTLAPQATAQDLFRVYNRHLTGGVDDRDNPKLELYTYDGAKAGRFPDGAQNVEVTGVFGYTEPGGAPWGSTPDDIRRVTQLLVFRDAAKLVDAGLREDARWRGRVTSEKTRDQSYTLATPRELGMSSAFTGDPEVDQILAAYRVPIALGAA